MKSSKANHLNLVTDLKERIRREEAAFSKQDRGSNTLFDHLERVSALAKVIAEKEDVDSLDCRLAGLFHDAGKFNRGEYHKDNRPEEERSCEVLDEIGRANSLSLERIERVKDAIRQIYRDDPDMGAVSKVLFDADNLDKLGPLGVANYFVKKGLRGGGVSIDSLYRLTVELTYAEHAPKCLHTKTGREMAALRAPETTAFFKHFLDVLRQDGLYDFSIKSAVFNGLLLKIASPASCECGGELDQELVEIAGMKCTEIHLIHSCKSCSFKHEQRFCRPRLVN